MSKNSRTIRNASFLALVALIGTSPTLAQQYCVSGVVTQAFGPTFNVGDAISVTATVQPSSTGSYCQALGGGVVFCQARILLQVSSGTQNFWNDDKLPPFQAGNLTAQWDGSASTFSFTGQALPDPSSASQNPVNLGFQFNQFKGNILAGNTLPPGLPTPAQLGSAVQFYAGDTGDPVRYTGQTCASLPSSSSGPPGTSTITYPKILGDCSCKYGSSDGPFSPSAGDPIDIASRNMFYSATDYQTAGQNRLAFARYYNSLSNSAGVSLASTLGVGWRSTYDRYLRIVSASSVTAERANGQMLNFSRNGGVWTSDADVDLTLTSTGSTWMLTDHSDFVETYNTIGTGEAVLSSIVARNGYSQTLTYNAGNQLISVTDSYARTFTFTYSSGLLQTLTTPDGLVLTYGYAAVTGGSHLTKVSYSTTPITSQTYVYETVSLPFALTGIIDENGARYVTWSYDAKARGTSSQFGGGANLTYVAYNDADGSRAVTNAGGVVDIYKYVVLQGVPKITEIDRAATATTAAATQHFGYDTNGYTALVTDWNGNRTLYVNDAHGQPTTITEAQGTPAARITTITYDSSFVHLPQQIVTPGLTTSFTYDGNGEVLTKIVTDTITQTVPYATAGQSRTWTYSWANSLLASVQGPRTDVQQLTKFSYDASGALTATTNALGQTTKITQHLPGGLPQTVVDPNTVTTNLTYDAKQRLLTSAVVTSRGVLTTKYTYDAAGNLVTTTLPDGSALTSSFDTAHRLTGVTDLLKQSIVYGLDAFGDRLSTIVADASAKPQRQHYGTFDALGRQTQDIGGSFQTTQFTYDPNGNTQSVADPLGHVTGQTFDALNRPVSTTDAAGNVTYTGYDAHDRPVSVTDPNGGTTAYIYDGYGELLQQVSPVTGATVYHYDLTGNLTQRVDARGVITNYSYDALNRKSADTYPGNASENVTYVYDEPSGIFGIGRLTRINDTLGMLYRHYDERGDIVAEIRMVGNVLFQTGYSFDAAQRISGYVNSPGLGTLYTRDVTGRITGVSVYASSRLRKKALFAQSVNEESTTYVGIFDDFRAFSAAC